MPFINSKITMKISKEKEEILKVKLGKAIESIPGKSEAWLMVGFEDEYTLYFKGEAPEKAAMVEVKIFGHADRPAYDKLTKAICDIYKEELGIPGNQVYITYEEVTTWGYNGFNF